MIYLPEFALSVRQPWAWAIVHSRKDIENRSWSAHIAALRTALAFRGPVCIHTSKGMTRDEYEGALETFHNCGVIGWPKPDELLRGGIIGTVEIVDVVRKSDSPWFFGSIGLVLANPQPIEFIPSTGALGYFRWQPNPEGAPDVPAKWMLPAGQKPQFHQARDTEQETLL